MKISIGIGSIVLAAVLVLTFSGPVTRADDGPISICAHLRGLAEVPPNATPATGEFQGTISSDRTSITFTLDWENLKGGPPAVAHIHFGPPRVNGAVMVFLCGGGGQDPCQRATSGHAEGTIAAANVGTTAFGQGIDPGDLQDVIEAILSGNAYANIHTPPRFPGGEIRGKVIVGDE